VCAHLDGSLLEPIGALDAAEWRLVGSAFHGKFLAPGMQAGIGIFASEFFDQQLGVLCVESTRARTVRVRIVLEVGATKAGTVTFTAHEKVCTSFVDNQRH
jgi:hypothetical protein